MGMHLSGDRCPACRKKGLVLGGFNFLTEEPLVFRPMGWLIDRLEVHRGACSHCGFVILALTPPALKRLKEALKEERKKETVTYYPRSKRPKKKGG